MANRDGKRSILGDVLTARLEDGMRTDDAEQEPDELATQGSKPLVVWKLETGTRCELSFAQTMSNAYMYIQTVDMACVEWVGGATTCAHTPLAFFWETLNASLKTVVFSHTFF